MTKLRVHFDGKVLVPEEPVDLPTGKSVEIQVVPEIEQARGTLADLADWAQTLKENPDSPTDGAAQHDHYLYGTPKKP